VKSRPVVHSEYTEPYCMAPITPVGAKDEYVCFSTGTTAGSTFNRSIPLPAGTYSVGWWNPRGNGWGAAPMTVTHNGGPYLGTPPDGLDWVLWAKRL
jgi:hypothetical protein